MKFYKFLLLVVFSVLIACASNVPTENTNEKNTVTPALINTRDVWRLNSPSTGSACEIFLSFSDNNKMQMIFQGESFEGYYEIDSVLTNYISLNIFNKKGWDDECPVNPEYLTLYDEDTQFSYTLIDSMLYFQKAEKSIVFKRVPDHNI